MAIVILKKRGERQLDRRRRLDVSMNSTHASFGSQIRRMWASASWTDQPSFACP